VLACGKRLLRQLEMESRRDRYDDGVDAAIRDRLVIAAKRCPAAELAAMTTVVSAIMNFDEFVVLR